MIWFAFGICVLQGAVGFRNLIRLDQNPMGRVFDITLFTISAIGAYGVLQATGYVP